MQLDPDLRSLQEVRHAMAAAVRAQASIARLDQAGTDALAGAMAEAAEAAALDLARSAVEETGIGRAVDKLQKNRFASRGVWESIRAERTVGILSSAGGVTEIASPIGVVCGIVPTTNPTSTAIGKALIAVKGRNAIVFSPHPRAVRCIGQTVEVLRRALERCGADPDLVQCLAHPTLAATAELMGHADMKLILATGGAGLVQAAYSSGKPAYGVGPGNVPVYVDPSADLAAAARWITASQSFDNATLCCSEQALVLHAGIAEALLAGLVERGAHRCSAAETLQLERFAVRGGHMNPEVVGKDPAWVARAAGFEVPSATTILLAEQAGVGPEFPLSAEVLCPLLSVHRVDDWHAGCAVSHAILRHGGLGHTIGLWARDEALIEAWALEKPASRIVTNGPTSMGAVGWSTALMPSMSLGCGPLAGNITSENISARHLINVKRLAPLRADFEQTYAESVRSAQAQFDRAGASGSRPSGGEAPRGSGLSGDPALRATVRAAGRPSPLPTTQRVEAQSWRPASAAGAAPAVAPRSVAPPSVAHRAAAPQRTSAPRPPLEAPASVPVQQSAPAPAPTPGPSHQGLLGALPALGASAGAGCPLGPCRGCPHQDRSSGACTA